MPRAVSIHEFYSKPAPESEDDLEVPGQPYLGLLGILSEYYKYKEPNHKQGRVLGNALRYLYRVKKKLHNGSIDENFGIEIMNAVSEVMSKTPEVTKKKAELPSAEQSGSSKEEAPSELKKTAEAESNDLDYLSDFGFSSDNSSDNEFESKIDSIVKMVKNTVKKKKKKRQKEVIEMTSDMSDDNRSIPKLKIRLSAGRPSSDYLDDTISSCDDSLNCTDGIRRCEGGPMKLKIKLGTPPKDTSSPLLPPPPLLTKYASPSESKDYSPSISDNPSNQSCASPNYAPDAPQVKSDCAPISPEIKPAIKLTLRVQTLRSTKDDAVVLPRAPIKASPPENMPSPCGHDDKAMIRFETASLECSDNSPHISTTSSPPSLPELPKLKPAPPNLKPAPSLTMDFKTRKRKRVSSPKHDCVIKLTEPKSPSPKPLIPPLKIPKVCKKVLKETWDCGIFSNSLKMEPPHGSCDELDFRSNILPIYCGINYMKQKLNYAIPFDIWLAYENGDLPKKVPGKSGAVKDLVNILDNFTDKLPPLLECEYAFEEEERKKKSKRGRRSRKAAPTNSKSSTTSNEADDCIQPISPLQSPDHSPGLIIESDCDSPLPPPSSCPSDSPTQTTINSTTFIADSLHITTSPPTSEGIPGKGDNEAEDSCHTVTKTTSDIEKHDLDYEENRIDTEITFSNSPTKETNLLNHTNHNPANAVKSTCL